MSATRPSFILLVAFVEYHNFFLFICLETRRNTDNDSAPVIFKIQLGVESNGSVTLFLQYLITCKKSDMAANKTISLFLALWNSPH